MRIFYAVDHQPFSGNNLWYNNLYLPLCDLGHEVVPFEWDLLPYQNMDPCLPASRPFLDTERPKLEKALIDQISSAHRDKKIDLFFSYFHSAFCRPETIREIRAMGIQTVNWFCNGSYQFNMVEELSPAYDYCLVPEKFRLLDYRRIGANPIYCQEAANPTIYRPYPGAQEYDVTFVGAAYGDRIDQICHLLDNRIDVHVWGPRWLEWADMARLRSEDSGQASDNGKGHTIVRRMLKQGKAVARRILGRPGFVATKRLYEMAGAPLTDEEMVRMYSRSKINLGFSSCGNTHLTKKRILQVRLRDFEVPMSGGFYMVEYMEELEDFFDIGKEIVCYRDAKDLLSKIQYYLSHPEEREVIRQAGRQRCLADHTWQKRLSDAFREMGLTR